MNNYWYLGVTRAGRFLVLRSEPKVTGTFRVTRSAPGEPPEPGETPLGGDEEVALMVRGIHRDGWICAASIVDRAGPILTAVVEQVFSPPAPAAP